VTPTRRGPNRAHRFGRTTTPHPRDPLLVEWVDQLRTERKSKRTIDVYARTVTRFASQSGVSPVSACRADVITWFNDHDDWSRNYAAQNFSGLWLWFCWLVRENHRPDNPMLRMAKVTFRRGEPRPVSDSELGRLLALPRLHQRTRLMIMLAALAGLRAAEIARVKGTDVDLSQAKIWVRGKGGAVKSVPLHQMLSNAAASMPAQGFWFPSEHDPERPMRSESVSSTIGKAMSRAGVSGTPHALRHWYGSSLLANGADLRTVQECMRHASIVATQIYTRVPDDRRHEAVGTLNPFGR
jgi:integrase/recombinase XerD